MSSVNNNTYPGCWAWLCGGDDTGTENEALVRERRNTPPSTIRATTPGGTPVKANLVTGAEIHTDDSSSFE